MTELPQATSRRELREREQALAAQGRSSGARREGASRSRRPEKARPVRDGKAAKPQDSRAHTVGSRLLSFGALIFAGALAFGMSVPANAFYPADSSGGSAPADPAGTAGQTVAVPSDEPVDVGGRDKVEVLSWAQVLAQKYAHGGASVGGTTGGSIRWPFPYAVTISSPYGPRVAPCSGCSTFHNGVDFTPGANAAIFAVADGVVTVRDDGTSAYGNYAVITSQLGGRTVRFTYAHMARGSSALVLGQKVAVGDFLGLVGMTGEATGPHLHFEVDVDGTTIDPIPWLEANVN